jgi:hypothetical protein
MDNNNVIVWDLETIPDLKGFAAANYLTGKTDAEIREVMGDKFPKHIFHSIACIGALIAHREDDCWVVDAVGAPHIGERSEKELIQAFVDISGRRQAFRSRRDFFVRIGPVLKYAVQAAQPTEACGR